MSDAVLIHACERAAAARARALLRALQPARSRRRARLLAPLSGQDVDAAGAGGQRRGGARPPAVLPRDAQGCAGAPAADATVVHFSPAPLSRLAQAAKSIPGLLAIDIHEDPWTPGLFNVWERYQTYAELAEHGSSQRQTAFEEKLLPLTRSGIGITLNIWEDGKLGHACVGIGPKGEGGLDDSTGASGTAGGGAGYKQTVKVGANTHRDLEGDTFGLKQASEVKRKD